MTDSAGEQVIIQVLEDKLVKVNTWMNLNRLKLNPDKTEEINVDDGVGLFNCIICLGACLDEQISLNKICVC